MINFKYANLCGYSDTTPYEVVRVISNKTVEIRAMKAELDPTWEPKFHIGGFSAHCYNQHEQRWIITSDESAPVIRARRRIDGYFHSAYGRHMLNDRPAKFYDYNF